MGFSRLMRTSKGKHKRSLYPPLKHENIRFGLRASEIRITRSFGANCLRVVIKSSVVSPVHWLLEKGRDEACNYLGDTSSNMQLFYVPVEVCFTYSQ